MPLVMFRRPCDGTKVNKLYSRFLYAGFQHIILLESSVKMNERWWTSVPSRNRIGEGCVVWIGLCFKWGEVELTHAWDGYDGKQDEKVANGKTHGLTLSHLWVCRGLILHSEREVIFTKNKNDERYMEQGDDRKERVGRLPTLEKIRLIGKMVLGVCQNPLLMQDYHHILILIL